MSKTAIIFPGQGAQKVGMAQDLFNNNDQATEILTSAAKTLDFDILEQCLLMKKVNWVKLKTRNQLY